MTKIIYFLLLLPFLGISQVGIGTVTANSSSALEISSTNSGFLMPRITQTQRDAIATPSTGLLIFQTDNTTGLYFFNSSAWLPFGGDNTLAFPKLPIPALSLAPTGSGSDFTFTKTVKGVNYSITRRTFSGSDGATDISQRIRLRYTFSPALPYTPSAKAITPNQGEAGITDGVSISCRRLTNTVLVVDVYRIDAIGSVNVPWETIEHNFDAVFYE